MNDQSRNALEPGDLVLYEGEQREVARVSTHTIVFTDGTKARLP